MAPPIVAQQAQQAQQMQMDQDDYYDNMSVQYDQTPDDVTVASYAEEDVYNQSAPSSQRKRKREPDFGQQQQQQVKTSAIDQAHIIYSDELLDYFMLAQKAQHADRPEPPANFNPDWHIDSDGHTALHWAASMGDLEVMKQLKSFNANIDARNIRGETPLMRAMIFTNCMDKQTCPKVAQELIATVKSQDNNGKTAIHHAADLTQYRTKQHCARYYLDVLLNKVCEVYDPDDVQHILDIQDIEGNTAAHIAANNKARKCLRALMGRGANIEIPNIHGRRVEELIPELNQSRRPVQALSSSPYAPQSHRRNFSYPEPSAPTPQLNLTSVLQNARKESHHSEAAQTLSTKVGPSVNAKLEDLKNSYNQELQERENSEKEARRILAQTQADLAAVQRLIEEFGEGGEDKAGAKNEVSQLSRAQGMVVSLVEQQQAILLSQKVAEFEKMGVNGDDVEMGENGDLETMGRLLDELREQQVKRTKLVGEYIAALADRGVGEKADMYRRLTANCLSVEEKMVDSRIDEILVSLEEENEGLE